jgi:hypothetical protein
MHPDVPVVTKELWVTSEENKRVYARYIVRPFELGR